MVCVSGICFVAFLIGERDTPHAVALIVPLYESAVCSDVYAAWFSMFTCAWYSQHILEMLQTSGSKKSKQYQLWCAFDSEIIQ